MTGGFTYHQRKRDEREARDAGAKHKDLTVRDEDDGEVLEDAA